MYSRVLNVTQQIFYNWHIQNFHSEHPKIYNKHYIKPRIFHWLYINPLSWRRSAAFVMKSSYSNFFSFLYTEIHLLQYWIQCTYAFVLHCWYRHTQSDLKFRLHQELRWHVPWHLSAKNHWQIWQIFNAIFSTSIHT